MHTPPVGVPSGKCPGQRTRRPLAWPTQSSLRPRHRRRRTRQTRRRSRTRSARPKRPMRRGSPTWRRCRRGASDGRRTACRLRGRHRATQRPRRPLSTTARRRRAQGRGRNRPGVGRGAATRPKPSRRRRPTARPRPHCGIRRGWWTPPRGHVAARWWNSPREGHRTRAVGAACLTTAAPCRRRTLRSRRSRARTM